MDHNANKTGVMPCSLFSVLSDIKYPLNMKNGMRTTYHHWLSEGLVSEFQETCHVQWHTYCEYNNQDGHENRNNRTYNNDNFSSEKFQYKLGNVSLWRLILWDVPEARLSAISLCKDCEEKFQKQKLLPVAPNS